MVKRLRVLFMVVMCLGVLLALAVPALAVHRPTHVMIVVMDQMQPGYAKQFAMTNVLSLQQHGVTFPNAYVGDMASETVVSHNVMVSGQFPKHMGWSDEAFRDVDNVLGFGANAIVTSGDLGYDQYVKLVDAWDYKKLGDYLHEKFPGTVVANVGEKGYQVESMAASSSDWYVRMGSKKKVADLTDPSVVPWTGTYRGPSGKVPDYIKSDNRYLVSVGNATDTYGTEKAFPSWLYPEDGRYVGGPYDDHQSGDRWVADATLAIMDKENWSGLWVTFSAMDKIGHMWGGGAVDTLANYQWDPSTIVNQVHMQWIATNADAMLGALIAELKTKGIYDDTLIILTADHGSTYGKGEGFEGDDAYDAGNLKNWYGGAWHAGVSTESTSTGSVSLKPLMDTGNVEFSYQSTAIETWLKDWSMAKKKEAAAVMETLPGVIATYVKTGDRYKLYSHMTGMTGTQSSWWAAHGQELVDTMCWAGSADVVGLLADYTTYGVFGDHGGAQMDVQKIPMAFFMPGIKRAVDSKTAFRLVDIMPTTLKAMGIAPTEQMDGSAYKLKLPK
jgi:predicted AlkP superfamily pyrophosphatase or phosphodiesterase